MSTLEEVLETISSRDPEMCIYVVRPWSGRSHAIVAEDEADDLPPGYEYFLETDIACDAIAVWERWHDRAATSSDKVRAVIHYAVNDAFLAE